MPDKRNEGSGAQWRDVVWPSCIAPEYRHDFAPSAYPGRPSAYERPASARSESRAMT